MVYFPDRRDRIESTTALGQENIRQAAGVKRY